MRCLRSLAVALEGCCRRRRRGEQDDADAPDRALQRREPFGAADGLARGHLLPPEHGAAGGGAVLAGSWAGPGARWVTYISYDTPSVPATGPSGHSTVERVSVCLAF